MAVRHEEAYQFACNAIAVGKKAVISKGCRRLERELRKRGLPHTPTRIGRHYLYPREAVLKWILGAEAKLAV